MISTINHNIRLARYSVRNLHYPKRSDRWPKIEKEFLIKNPKCACCGGIEKLNVHHIHPFHLYPEEELFQNNLITLCMALDRHCHLLIGHGDDFKAFNPLTVQHSQDVIKVHPIQIPSILKSKAQEAKIGRLYTRISS